MFYGIFDEIISSKQDWNGDLFFDPDSSPKAWEHYKKFYNGKQWTEKYNFKKWHFFEYANDSRGLYVDFPLSFYNRLNALEKNIHPSLEENRFKYYSASQRLAGETDFNFNDKKYDLFLKLLFRDYKSDEEKFYKSLSKLKECKRMHHTLANFSLIQVVGNMQGFKSKGLRLKNGKHEWLDRLDTFVYMLNDFYRLDNEKRKLHSIIKNAGRYNNELLLYHLNDFNRED